MIRVDGFDFVRGYDQDAFIWSEDDGDVGDWQTLISQGITTAGTIYNNRLAAKAGRQVLGLQGPSTLGGGLQPIPGAAITEVRAESPKWLPWAIGGGIILVGFFLLRR